MFKEKVQLLSVLLVLFITGLGGEHFNMALSI